MVQMDIWHGSTMFLVYVKQPIMILAGPITISEFMTLHPNCAMSFSEKNKINNKARLVAGYCWDWVSDKDPNAYDIVIPEDNFRMKWNLKTYGSKWIIDPDVNQ